MDFDFLGHYQASQIMEDPEEVENYRRDELPIDREYVWEGEEMMYEDIVASTQPLYYNPAYLRKFDYHNFRPEVNFYQGDEESDAELELDEEMEDLM